MDFGHREYIDPSKTNKTMKERTKQLIKEYKGIIELLRAQRDIAMDEGNVTLASKFGIGIFVYERVIKDLEELLTL